MKRDFDKDFVFPPTQPHKPYTSVAPVRDYKIILVLAAIAVIAYLYFHL